MNARVINLINGLSNIYFIPLRALTMMLMIFSKKSGDESNEPVQKYEHKRQITAHLLIGVAVSFFMVWGWAFIGFSLGAALTHFTPAFKFEAKVARFLSRSIMMPFYALSLIPNYIDFIYTFYTAFRVQHSGFWGGVKALYHSSATYVTLMRLLTQKNQDLKAGNNAFKSLIEKLDQLSEGLEIAQKEAVWSFGGLVLNPMVEAAGRFFAYNTKYLTLIGTKLKDLGVNESEITDVPAAIEAAIEKKDIPCLAYLIEQHPFEGRPEYFKAHPELLKCLIASPLEQSKAVFDKVLSELKDTFKTNFEYDSTAFVVYLTDHRLYEYALIHARHVDKFASMMKVMDIGEGLPDEKFARLSTLGVLNFRYDVNLVMFVNSDGGSKSRYSNDAESLSAAIELLGVEASDDFKGAKKKYFKLSRASHPDKVDNESTEKQAEINGAWELLKQYEGEEWKKVQAEAKKRPQQSSKTQKSKP